MNEEPEWLGPEGEFHNLTKMREYLRELRAIADTGGMKYLAAVCKTRYHAIMAGIASQPLSSLDAALEQEYRKGQALAFLTLESLVPDLIQDFEHRIEVLMNQQATEEDDD